LAPIEIKASQTINSHFFDGIKAWIEMTENDSSQGYLVYGGDEKLHQWHNGYILGWRDIKNMADTIETSLHR
jgi:hypothetical protein